MLGRLGRGGVQRGRRCWVIEREMARGGEERSEETAAVHC